MTAARTMADRRGFDGGEVLAAVAPAEALRTAAELAALRLIRAGLRHPQVTNPHGMATDVAQALGLIPTVPATPHRSPLTGGRVQPDRPTTRDARTRRPCRGCSHGTSKHTVLGCTTSGCYCRQFVAPATATA